MAKKKLVRSANKVLAGVCGGLAENFGMDATLVRILYTVLTVCSAAFPGVLIYLIMLLIMPQGGPNDRYEDAQIVG